MATGSNRLFPVVALLVSAAGPAAAQQMWAGSITAGFSRHVGDAFGGRGSAGAAIAVERRLAPRLALGVELGHHRLGSDRTIIPNGQGGTIQEDYGWSVSHIGGITRLGFLSGDVGPYASLGLGFYDVRTRDVIVERDAAGNGRPDRDFRQILHAGRPGFSLGAGVELRRSVGLGISARWHRLVDVGVGPRIGFADLLTIGVEMRIGGG